MDKRKILELLQTNLTPELVSQIEAQLPDDAALADNQNQNQGGLEDFAKMKPEALREMLVGVSRGEEVMDNQNQNQGKLDELMRLKPAVLRDLRAAMNFGEEVMDNQNQNQGTVATEQGSRKPAGIEQEARRPTKR